MSRPPERSTSTRCAAYIRKSTEEGLEQAFNSLDAQREACLAYIASQKHGGFPTRSRRQRPMECGWVVSCRSVIKCRIASSSSVSRAQARWTRTSNTILRSGRYSRCRTNLQAKVFGAAAGLARIVRPMVMQPSVVVRCT